MPFDSAVVARLARISVQAIVLAAPTWTFLFVRRARRADVRHAVWSIMSSRWLPAALAALSASMAMGAIVGETGTVSNFTFFLRNFGPAPDLARRTPCSSVSAPTP